jgi:hypothetical protein
MEKEKIKISNHTLKTDYSITGKLKTIIIGWGIYLFFLITTRIPEIQKILLQISSSFSFLTNQFWYFICIPMGMGTIRTLMKKHPFTKINIYDTGVGFIDENGIEKYLEYSKIKINYVKRKQSFIMELQNETKIIFEYGWSEFSQPDVLRNNLERYGTW